MVGGNERFSCCSQKSSQFETSSERFLRFRPSLHLSRTLLLVFFINMINTALYVALKTRTLCANHFIHLAIDTHKHSIFSLCRMCTSNRSPLGLSSSAPSRQQQHITDTKSSSVPTKMVITRSHRAIKATTKKRCGTNKRSCSHISSPLNFFLFSRQLEYSPPPQKAYSGSSATPPSRRFPTSSTRKLSAHFPLSVLRQVCCLCCSRSACLVETLRPAHRSSH